MSLPHLVADHPDERSGLRIVHETLNDLCGLKAIDIRAIRNCGA
jgi:hypothetical protein